jgi:DNA-directed RNA polymerase subunit H (RpoH/RPB5)
MTSEAVEREALEDLLLRTSQPPQSRHMDPIARPYGPRPT